LKRFITFTSILFN